MATAVIAIAGLLGTLPNRAAVTASRLLGSVSMAAGMAANGASVSVPRLLGDTRVRACQPRQARAAVGRLMGWTRVRAQCLADEWSSAGFPPPTVSGYGYSKDAGIVRTEFRSGATRQRRKWTDGRRVVNASFVIPSDQLYAVETFVTEKGYDWVTMGLITGDNTSDHVRVHLVRIKGNPKVGNVYGDTLTLTLELEL